MLGAREEEVRRARDLAAGLLATLGLTFNEEKTRLCRAEDGFVFLGYHFGPAGRGPAVRAVEALRCRLQEFEAAEAPDAEEVDALYRGWTGYFGQHPECWTGSAAGLLALLRNEAPGEPGRLAEARLRLAAPVPPRLGLALAEAWAARGQEEQSWLELAAACGGSRSQLAAAEGWARLLRVTPEALTDLTRRLVGAPAERLAALAEALAELGRYEVASRLAAARPGFAAAAAVADVAEGEEPAPPRDGAPASEDDLRLLAGFFQGREGVHATESVDKAGHRSFMPVHRPLLPEDWQAHLRGERTLALPLVRAGDSALLGVLDVDLERRLLDERPGEVDELLGRALGTALKLRAEIRRRGGDALLELSGAKGYHLWVRLAEPAPCFQLRRWLLGLVRAVGPLPEGVRVEEFPNRDRVRPEEVGPLVKLPLGVHGRTGRRCALLDDLGRELADPLEAVRTLPRLAAEAFARELPAAAGPPGGADRSEPPAIGPRARRILDGCHVLGHLARKAEQTSHLNHRERSSLLCVLGHLGEEGREALHAIIGRTYNYKAEVTGRQIERLPPWPISCPKLRELHPEAAAVRPCACQFELRGRAYPTPLLYALRAAEVPAFKAPPRERRTEERAPADTLPKEVEEKVRRIAELKRHRRGIEASLDRAQAELAALFEDAGAEALQLSMGLLRRVPRAEGGWDLVIEV